MYKKLMKIFSLEFKLGVGKKQNVNYKGSTQHTVQSMWNIVLKHVIGPFPLIKRYKIEAIIPHMTLLGIIAYANTFSIFQIQRIHVN